MCTKVINLLMSFKNQEQCKINIVFLSVRVNKCIYKTPQTNVQGVMVPLGL